MGADPLGPTRRFGWETRLACGIAAPVMTGFAMANDLERLGPIALPKPLRQRRHRAWTDESG